ncbi:cysteine proteinase, partial [Sparassis latifolia]
EFLLRAIYKARESLNASVPPVKPFTPSLDRLRSINRARDEAIERQLHGPKPLPSSLPPEDEAAVKALLAKKGVIAKCGREQVTDQDIMRLKPLTWLNDEIINFYGQMLLNRSEESKENVAANGRKVLNIHYFNTFFWAKLTDDGYEKGRLAKWTKKFDIFEKDVVLIPVNHKNLHWSAAAINFRRKRIESYDSMGPRRSVCKYIREYLDAEHRNKKRRPFDFTGWQDYNMPDIIQENGSDCGVFACQFMESLSRGQETFVFTQADMPYLRRRMIWEIGNVKLRDDT